MTRFILSNATGEQTVYTWYVNDQAQVYINGTLTIDDPFAFCTIFRSDVASCSGAWPGCGTCPNPILNASYPFTIRITAKNNYNPGYGIAPMILRDLDSKIDYPLLLAGIDFPSASTGSGYVFLDQTWTIAATPTNITAINVTIIPQTCIEPCNITVNVTWQNTGGLVGTFGPAIMVNSLRSALSPVTIYPGESITKTFAPSSLTRGIYTICPDPN